MPDKPRSPPRYPLLKQLMDWHLRGETNGEVLGVGVRLQALSGARRTQAYRSELESAYGASSSQFNKICAGNSGPRLVLMLSALGYAPRNGKQPACIDPDLRAQAEWEFIAACELPPRPDLYRSALDAQRLAWGTHQGDMLKAHLPSRLVGETLNASTPVEPTSPNAAQTARDSHALRTAVQNEVVRRFGRRSCSAWLRLLASECIYEGFDGHDQKPAQLRAMLTALRDLAANDRAGPLYAVAKSLRELSRQQGRLEPAVFVDVQAAAHAVFALCLMDYAVEAPATAAFASSTFITTESDEFLAAVVLLDDALGHVTEFGRPAPGALQPGQALQVDVRDLMTTGDHAPGVLPGRAGEASREQIAGWLLPFFESRDQHGFGSADGSESSPVSDRQLKSMLASLARTHGRRLRAALDLRLQDAPGRLELLRLQSQQFGLPAVAFGQPLPAASAVAVGTVRRELTLEVHVTSLLVALDDLCPPAHDARHD